MRSSTPGRWARRIGVPVAAVIAAALVGAPAFAATSTPSKPAPPGCVVIGQPGNGGPVTLPAPGKPGKCVICVVKKDPGTGGEQGTTGAGTTGAAEQGTDTSGKPVTCPACPLPPGKPGASGPAEGTAPEGTGPITPPPGQGPGKGCVICIVIKPAPPGTTPAPNQSQNPIPVPGKPVKCEVGTAPGTK